MEDYTVGRRFLKANWEGFGGKRNKSDQQKGKPRPAPEKPFPEGSELIDLVPPEDFTVGDMPLREVIAKRQSRRKYTNAALTLEELSFLCWATQGVRSIEPASDGGVITRRTVPSGGARHPFETYICANRVEGLQPGLYRYLPMEHKLVMHAPSTGSGCSTDSDLADRIAEGCCGQSFVGDGAVVFIWTAIPYRMEWRYTTRAHKTIALDAGHLCQNLYLAAEAIGAGTCAIAAYLQDRMDAILGLDGEEEFVVYVAPVGKV